MNPNKESNWRLNVNDSIITDEQMFANTLNEFFIEKITLLKQGINTANVEDPMTSLNRKMSKNKLKFSLKKGQ